MNTVPSGFPSHDINPKQKGRDWHLQFAKAAWQETTEQASGSVFYRNAIEYDRIRRYVTGTQPIDDYRRMLTGDEQADTTWMNIDWSIRRVVNKNRDIAISKLLQRLTNITATPVDALAKDQLDQYFANVKTKIMLRDALAQANPELASHPLLLADKGEAEDLEELEMQLEYGAKHNMAMEAEIGIRLVHFQNDFTEHRKSTMENLFDFGVAGYKEWIDEKGKVRERAVRPNNVVVSPCRNADFSDATYVGEVIFEDFGALAEHFSEAELKDLASKVAGKNGNPQTYSNNTIYSRGYDKFKVEVLDLEFYSWDETVYKQRLDRRGNTVYRKTKWEDRMKVRNITIDDEMEDKYTVRKAKMVYKCKWIIGTDLIYCYQKANYLKRVKSNLSDTTLSYHLYALNFHDMQAHGYMERLIPIIDEYQMTIYKIQNFKLRWIPYIIDIDLDALEGVALGKAGVAMKPMELIDMMFQTHVLVGRRKDQGGNPNYKSVEVRPTNMAEEFAVLVQDLQRLLLEMQQMCGLNEITDGSTPNERMLNGVADLANMSTNNALYPLLYADKRLVERVSTGVIQRLQIAVKQGPVEGYAPSLGANTVKFWKVSQDIQLHEFGIILEDRPTDQEKQLLFEKMNLKDAQGLIEPEDWVLALTVDNMKQLAQLLAYRVRKRKEEQQQQAMQLQQQNGQIQQQSAMVAEEEKRKTMALQHELTMKEIAAKGEIEMRVAQMKLEQAMAAAQLNNQTKIATTAMQVDSQEHMQKQEMSSEAVEI